MDQAKLKVAFLIGADNSPTRRSIEAVCQLPGVEPAAILLDTATVPYTHRLKNLSRNFRASGWTYPVSRLIGAIRAATDTAVRSAAVSRAEVRTVLTQAFPDRCFSLEEVGARYRASVHAAGNLNGPDAVRILKSSGADLGIVLGTRILKPGTFSIPRLGSINLHKGKVPSTAECRPVSGSCMTGSPKPALRFTLSTSRSIPETFWQVQHSNPAH
jgi:hypothetical protein